MSDLSRIVDEMCAWFDVAEPSLIPTLPTSAEDRGNGQVHVIVDVSHTSRSSHTENETLEKTEHTGSENAENPADGSRVTSSYVEEVGSVGNVGSGAKTLAGSTSLPFPQELENVGSVGTDEGLCEPSHTISPPGDPFPISPAAVHAGVERELRGLAEDGREGLDALRDAVAITRAKIRNSPALAERQVHDGRCHACDQALDGTRPEVAVLNPGGRALYLHHGECHEAHGRRRSALVDRIMAAAGYGAEQSTGEAA